MVGVQQALRRRLADANSRSGDFPGQWWQPMPGLDQGSIVQYAQLPGGLRRHILVRLFGLLGQVRWWFAIALAPRVHGIRLWRCRVPDAHGKSPLQLPAVPRELRGQSLVGVDCLFGSLRRWLAVAVSLGGDQAGAWRHRVP